MSSYAEVLPKLSTRQIPSISWTVTVFTDNAGGSRSSPSSSGQMQQTAPGDADAVQDIAGQNLSDIVQRSRVGGQKQRPQETPRMPRLPFAVNLSLSGDDPVQPPDPQPEPMRVLVPERIVPLSAPLFGSPVAAADPSTSPASTSATSSSATQAQTSSSSRLVDSGTVPRSEFALQLPPASPQEAFHHSIDSTTPDG